MAKPRIFHNRPDLSEGAGDGEAEEVGEGEAVETKEEGRVGPQGGEAEYPPSAEEMTKNRRVMRPLEAEKRRRRRKRTEGTGTERSQGGHQSKSIAWGETCPPTEVNADLPEFTPERAHMLLQEVYGNFQHHNNGEHLVEIIMDDTV